jgi:hypothetical protein
MMPEENSGRAGIASETLPGSLGAMMVTLTPDPSNPDRLVLSVTITAYLDKVLLQTLNEEVASAVREQAVKDLRSNKAVKAAIAKAATTMLLSLLGVKEEPNV